MRSFFYWLVQEVSPISWLVAIGLDLVWNLADGASIFTGLGVLCYPVVMAGIFTLCLLSVAGIQHFASGDEWKPALNKGLVFGIIAALPFSVVSLVAGAFGLLAKGSRGGNYDAAFGRFGLNYRELEKTIKQAALACGGVNGSWHELTMETAINTLERAGRLSRFEARELHELRIARNEAHHAETPANLSAWVDQSAQLLQKYRERFGAA
jgi:hypothetical protein